MHSRPTCRVPDCGEPVKSLGYCARHYDRNRRNGDPVVDRRLKRSVCTVDGCERPTAARGWCAAHYQRWRQYGDPTAPARRRGRPSTGSTDGYGYRKITVDGRAVKEHRYVMEQMLGRPLLPTESVHHRNGQRGDNRPENLELWTTSQPAGQRVADKVAWALELLELYGGNVLTRPPDKPIIST